MGFILSLLKFIIKFFIYIAIVIAIILLIPNLPPYTKFTSIEIEPTQPRTGALAPNGDLNNVEKLYFDKLVGPECFQVWNGEIFTGLATGELVKLSQGGHVTFVTQIGQPCTGIVHEHICGRPLGFVIDDKKKQLYVADAYHGIWRVDLKSYKKQLLVSPKLEIEGRKPMLFNSVALADNGDLYWTDSTSDYHLKDGALAIISDPSGRLFRYNPAKNESTVLLDNLWFANGVIISPDNQFLLVVETNRMRLLKYYVNGPKKGTTEVFIAGLPGTPDTVRNLPDGSGVLVALYAAFDDEHPLLLKSLATTPLARKAAARFMRLLEIPFEFLNTHFPHIIFEQIVYSIGHFASISEFVPGLSGLVQIDWDGKVVASYYNTDNSVAHISDAVVLNDKLYLGCPHLQNFIGAVPAPPLLKKAFNVEKPKHSEQNVPQKENKATTKDNLKNKPIEKKTIQKSDTVKLPTQEQGVKAAPVKLPEPKPAVPKENVKVAVKEELVKSTSKVAETKPKKEAVPESVKPKTGGPSPTHTKTESTKEAVPKPKVVAESAPQKAPKAEPKKTSSAKLDSKKPESVEIKTKVTEDEKPASKVEATTAKPEKVKKTPQADEPQIIVERVKKDEKAKTNKKAKKSPVPEEPQIIVQKVVPDEIPVVEEIPVDTTKPKDESLKVIKKSGPVEIPAPKV